MNTCFGRIRQAFGINRFDLDLREIKGVWIELIGQVTSALVAGVNSHRLDRLIDTSEPQNCISILQAKL